MYVLHLEKNPVSFTACTVIMLILIFIAISSRKNIFNFEPAPYHLRASWEENMGSQKYDHIHKKLTDFHDQNFRFIEKIKLFSCWTFALIKCGNLHFSNKNNESAKNVKKRLFRSVGLYMFL